MGFNVLFYIIFGTNLLTGGPEPVSVFFAYFRVLQKRNTKRSPNGMKLSRWSFLDRKETRRLGDESETQRGSHEVGGRVPYLMGPSGISWPSSFPIYTLIPWKHPGEPGNHFSTTATFCTRDIPSRDLFRHPEGGAFDHGGLLHQLYCPTDEAWVVYHRLTGP